MVMTPLGGEQRVGLLKVPVIFMVMATSVKVKIFDEQPVVVETA